MSKLICFIYVLLFIMLILAITGLAILGDTLQQARLEGQDSMTACNEIIKEER